MSNQVELEGLDLVASLLGGDQVPRLHRLRARSEEGLSANRNTNERKSMMRNTRRILPLTLLTMLLPLAASAQAPTPHRHGDAKPPGAEGQVMAGCEAMMARHHEMQQRMTTMDTELDELVAAMRTATGDDKVVATAAVVEALVEQRKSMHGMMMKHQPGMMQHMMQHMGGGEGMGECPMMKKMKAGGDAEAPAAGHSAHHPD